ncbi:MAG: tetratricopeptide repeat protein [Acidobacteria bacterium]|nr:tetratricopeptide repeat protein [Acidobacteriota bacterium]
MADSTRGSKISLRWARFSASFPACGFALLLTGVVALLACSPAHAEAAAQAARVRAPASNVTVEGNPQLFATLCALYAAGFEAEASSSGMNPLRARLRGELFKLQGPATEALRTYYREHLLADPGATLSRYVSFALVAGPPPKFTYTLRHDELPPDVLTIEDFGEVLAKFYQEAQIERLWVRVEPDYEREVDRLNGPLRELVFTTTGYLRELLQPGGPRTFAVYVEPLVGGKTNFRNYRDHYAIVLSPAGETPLEEIRHALLHFLLDPLAIRFPHVVSAKRPLLEFAARAPRLPAEYKDDFLAFATECLVRAVEIRLDARARRLTPQQLAAVLDAAEGDGYVLVRPVFRELGNFEKAEPAMSFYFPDLVRGVQLAEESKRLQSVTFAAATSASAEPPGGTGRPAQGSAGSRAGPGGEEDPEVAAALVEGERQIAAQNAAAAVAAFERALVKSPEQPRALYGLAVAAVLQGNADRARDLFRRLVLEPSRSGARAGRKDPLILAWSHVYLGRIYDVDGSRELAVSEYRAALAVEGAPEAARLAARRCMEKGYEPATRNP